MLSSIEHFVLLPIFQTSVKPVTDTFCLRRHCIQTMLMSDGIPAHCKKLSTPHHSTDASLIAVGNGQFFNTSGIKKHIFRHYSTS